MTSVHPHTRWRLVAVLGLLAACLSGLVVVASIWPGATAVPHGLPVAISGPEHEVRTVERALERRTADAVSWRRVRSRAAAVHAVKNRSVDGAVVLGDGVEIVRAGAAGPGETVIDRIGAGLSASTGAVRSTDVAPGARADPTGSVLSALAFPLAIGGLVGGVVVAMTVVHLTRRASALVLLAAGGAGIVIAVAHVAFGVLPGNAAILWAVVALSLLATSSLVVGLHAVMGPRGIVIAGATTLLLANPLSAASTPIEFIVGGLGTIGQFFVPGATLTLLRDTAYFPEAPRAAGWVTLAAWAGATFALAAVGHRRGTAAAAAAAVATPAPAPGRAVRPRHRAEIDPQ